MKKNSFFNKKTERIAIITACVLVLILIIMLLFTMLRRPKPQPAPESTPETTVSETPVSTPEVTPAPEPQPDAPHSVYFDSSWPYAENSVINSGSATLYYADPTVARGLTVCINAGHGTRGGSDVKTLCHPDGTPKVTGGTTEAGETYAVAVSSGTELKNGMSEAQANLIASKVIKSRLLADGFDVLMIRESDDVQLDNIARTLIASHNADCHIAIHYDSTDMDKGIFFMSVPSDESYRSMAPVSSVWQYDDALGRDIVSALAAKGFKLFEGGEMEMDLTQTSYSSIPTIDLEIGDEVTNYSDQDLMRLAEGISDGLMKFFGQ